MSLLLQPISFLDSFASVAVCACGHARQRDHCFHFGYDIIPFRRASDHILYLVYECGNIGGTSAGTSIHRCSAPKEQTRSYWFANAKSPGYKSGSNRSRCISRSQYRLRQNVMCPAHSLERQSFSQGSPHVTTDLQQLAPSRTR